MRKAAATRVLAQIRAVTAPAIDIEKRFAASDFRRISGRPLALGEPRAEEAFGQAIGASHIDVADAGVVGRLEERMRPAFHRFD